MFGAVTNCSRRVILIAWMPALARPGGPPAAVLPRARTSTFAWVREVNAPEHTGPLRRSRRGRFVFDGEPRRIRTYNLVIKSHLLYR